MSLSHTKVNRARDTVDDTRFCRSLKTSRHVTEVPPSGEIVNNAFSATCYQQVEVGSDRRGSHGDCSRMQK